MTQSAAVYGSREIKLNDSGEDVRELQIKIVAFGDPEANVPCDGVFGRNSEKALENFCKYFGLKSRKAADSEIFLQIEKWVESETEFLNIFKATFPCSCSGMSESRKPRALKMWKDKVKGALPLASGSLADMPTCTGFGSGLTKAHKFPTGSLVGGSTVEFAEKPGFNKILLWATLGARKILKSKLSKSALGMSINNGYRCQLKYFEILLQKFDADRMEEPVGIGNHIGNAIDLNISASTPSQARKILREANCFYETFDATENRLRLEPLDKSPRWTHIDTFTFKHQPYVTSVEDALAPRYTAGSATSPVVPPKGDSNTPPGSGGEKGGGAPSGGGGASSLDALLGYAEKSKEWLQNSFSTFFDAYREGLIADAHDAIQADDGFFPIGKNLTWHGGIHAVGQVDGSVHAITDGVVVAARIPEKDPAKLSFGSRNFVLVKHQTPAGKPFWALYMHLRPIPLKKDDPKVAMLFPWLVRQKLKQTGGGGSNFRVSPDGEAGVLRTIGQGETLVSIEAKLVGTQKWIKAKADKDGLVGWLALTNRFEVKSEIDQLAAIQAGKVVSLNLPVKRGDCLGYMSPPKPGKKPFLHWEIFSDQVVSNQWLQVKDEDNDIVCDAVKFKELLNKSKAVTFFDSLTDSDIVSAYSDPKISAEIRKRAYFFKSEWAVEWKSALEKLKDDFEVDDLAPRLEPYNFWKDAEAAKCDIPKGGKVWHYRPPEFIAREFPAAPSSSQTKESAPASGEISLSDAQNIALRVTTVFEGGELRYSSLAGNFDGAGISWGIIQWNIKSGTLQSVWKKMRETDPDAFKACFTTSEFSSITNMLDVMGVSQQLSWANGTHTVTEKTNSKGKKYKSIDWGGGTWKEAFGKLASIEKFQKIQREMAISGYHPPAWKAISTLREVDSNLMKPVHLWVYCAAFDLAVQQGGVGKATLVAQFKASCQGKTWSSQEELMLHLAKFKAEKANSEWRADCLSRRGGILAAKPYPATLSGKSVTLQNVNYSLLASTGNLLIKES